ncbi:hypothetical protein EJB05_55834, partial [Eragrostis curvula]
MAPGAASSSSSSSALATTPSRFPSLRQARLHAVGDVAVDSEAPMANGAVRESRPRRQHAEGSAAVLAIGTANPSGTIVPQDES